MRSLKKLLAVIVAICVLATFTIPAFAADSATYANADQATKLNSMGLYAGISTTSFDPDLGSTLTREQGMVILLKMFGQLDAANAMTDADTDAALAAFTDAKDLSSWAKKAFAYVVKNSISSGTSDTTLGPKGTFTGNQFATLILKEAGFTVADWTKAAEELTTKGVAGAGALATTVLTRDQLVGMAFGALTVNNAAGKTIVAALVDAGKVTAASAIAAGVYNDKLTATLAATGAKKLTVTFNQAVDSTKAAITVKKGVVTVNVASKVFAADNKSVVITLSGKITAGDYTVSVTGLADAAITAAVTATDEKVAKIDISGEAVITDAPANTTTVTNYTVYNQYNEDITSTASLSPYSSGTGVTASGGVATITYGAAQVIGGSATLTLIDTNSTTTASKVLTIAASAGVASIEITSLYNADNKTLTKDSTASEFKLVVEAKDQYGNALNAAALNGSNAGITTDDLVMVTNSNATVATLAGAPMFGTTSIGGVNKVTLALATVPGDGTTTVTIISKYNGKLSSFNVVVGKGVTTDTVSFTAPDMVAVDEEAVFGVDARDTNGNAITDITKFSGATAPTITATLGGDSFTPTFRKNSAGNIEMVFASGDIDSEGTLFINSISATLKVTSVSIPIKAKAVPTTFVGFGSDVTPNIYLSGVNTFNVDDIIVADQYGRTMGSTALTAALGTTADGAGNDDKYKIVFTSDSASIVVADAGGDDNTLSTTAGDTTVTLTAAATKGSATLTAKIYKGVAGAYVAQAASTYDFAMRSVAKDQIVSYELSPIGKFYNDQAAASYEKTLEVKGVLSDGTKVVVPNTLYTVNTNSALDVTANVIDDNDGAPIEVVAAGDDDVTVAVSVIVDADGGPQLLTQDMVVSSGAPAVNSIATNSSNSGLTLTGSMVTGLAADVVIADIAGLVKTTDQYGVETDPGTVGMIVVTNLKDADGGAPALAVANNGTSTATVSNVEAGDTFSVTMFFGSKSITFNVLAQ